METRLGSFNRSFFPSSKYSGLRKFPKKIEKILIVKPDHLDHMLMSTAIFPE